MVGTNRTITGITLTQLLENAGLDGLTMMENGIGAISSESWRPGGLW